MEGLVLVVERLVAKALEDYRLEVMLIDFDFVQRVEPLP
jgi:hypothetical protein